MNKFHGPIGFIQTVETKPGVWTETAVERSYYGDIIKRRVNIQQSSESINPNVSITTSVSILADPFANDNFHTIRYVKWLGKKWKISNVDVEYPRITIQLGGIYNGK